MRTKLFRGLMLASAAVVSLLISCIDPETSGATKGAALYVFDAADTAASRVLIWDNLGGVYDGSAGTTPTRALTGSAIDRVKNLAWGGMCLDPNSNRLYLVSQAGDVVRVERIRSQNGTLTSVQDVVSFRLGQTSDRLTNGTFGQASVDFQTGMLYVTESNDSDARIWMVSPSQVSDGGVVSLNNVTNAGPADSQGTGVAAVPGGTLYAYFGNGGTIRDPSQTGFDGPRLRRGAASGGFTHTSNVLIGGATQLAAYGALAYDFGNNRLYLARHLADSKATGAPIQVYSPSQFSQGFNQAPTATLGDATLNGLRVIAHSGSTSDWLVASSMSAGVGTNIVYLWKGASLGGAPKSLLVGSAVSVRGLALDGSN
jgi:hypothetical protein